MVVDLEPPQLRSEVDHLLHALLDAERARLAQVERALVLRDGDHAGRRAQSAEAAGEDEELAPSVDQQGDLVVNLEGRERGV